MVNSDHRVKWSICCVNTRGVLHSSVDFHVVRQKPIHARQVLIFMYHFRNINTHREQRCENLATVTATFFVH